jgi:hypothetical protein
MISLAKIFRLIKRVVVENGSKTGEVGIFVI